MKQIRKIISETNINFSFLLERKEYYAIKYIFVVSLLLLLNIFSKETNFFNTFVLLAFIFSLDFITLFLARDKNFVNNSKQLINNEIFILAMQSMSLILCIQEIISPPIRSFLGCLIVTTLIYFAIDIIQKNSGIVDLALKKHVKYIAFFILPLAFIDPFVYIFIGIYYLLYYLMVPAIILTLLYFVIDLRNRISFLLLGINIALLYTLLLLCL